MRIVFIIFCILSLGACQKTQPNKEQSYVPRTVAAYLEREQAQQRAARVSQVEYTLSLNLPEENIPFSGETKIRFLLKDASTPLTLDFVGGEVSTLTVNGKPTPIHYNGFFITVAAEYLSPGEQNIEVTYTHPYQRDGTGLHWFKDPEDGETYIFSQFEAWDFNKVFPGFDQPDIKATYTLDVQAPAHWHIVTYDREISAVMHGQFRKHWQFPTSRLFSTYLVPVHAGPYQVWEEETPFRTPLRIFARKSYANFVDVDEWFKVTRQGFDYFENYFEYDYPFDKYDQLLVPEFVFGAMENIGAVTFTERLQPRREKNRLDREDMATTVMHELAHHWFGNLVTMRWWDDIWLNESFADLMGHQATAMATEYKNALQSFSTSRKSWGYQEDQWITTHPIVQDIPHTEAVMASIDGITYAKGAASLIQIQHLLGKNTFQKGLANYFDQFAWRNTELQDFIGTLGATAQRDMTNWTQDWLTTSGTNGLKASYSCEGDTLQELTVEQIPANVSAALREHSFDILLIADDGSRYLLDAFVKQQHNPQTLSQDYPCPAFVLPNASDYTFAKILFDEASVQYLETHFDQFSSSVERALIWRALTESTLEAQIPATRYLDIAVKYLSSIEDPALLESQLKNVQRIYGMLYLRKFVREGANSTIKKFHTELEDLALVNYKKSEDAIKRTWFEFWADMASSKRSMAYTKAAIADKSLAIGDRWTLAGILVRNSQPQAKTWIASLAEIDKSSSAQLKQYIAEAQAPDLQTKIDWIEEVQNTQTKFAYTQFRAVLGSLFPLEQHDLNLELKNKIVFPIPDLSKSITPTLLSVYAGSIVPRECSVAAQKDNLDFAELPGMPKTAAKMFKKMSQLEDICVKMQARLDAELNGSND